MKKVKFTKDFLDFKKGKTYNVTDRTAEKLGDYIEKEEKKIVETKEEKAPVETKAKKTVKSPK